MKERIRGWALSLALLVFAGSISSGCSSVKSSMGFEEEPPPPPAPQYYDFPDVMIPPELSLDRQKSMIYEYGGMKAGVLFLTGRLEVGSLLRFFRTYLPRDGWVLVSSMKFSRNLLNFAKSDRTCQIIIQDRTLTTEVEVWVHPYKSPTQ